MTEPIETAGGLCLFLLGLAKKAARDFLHQAFRWRNLKYLSIYAGANLLIQVFFNIYESFHPTLLDIRGVPSPQTSGSFFSFIVTLCLYPLSILFEELAFRFLPMLLIRDTLQLDRITTAVEDDKGIRIIHNSRFRLWLYHYWTILFVAVSAFWAAWLHTSSNTIAASLVGIAIYFRVQFFSGVCFAWMYLRRGLGSSWCVHLLYDFLLVTLNLAILLL
jgi:hypothetical protein